MEQAPVIPGRACNGCTMCCWLLDIAELGKPAGAACPHCIGGSGCGIYSSRPTVCGEFFCGYLVLPFVEPRWFPGTCGMMIYPDAAQKRLAVHVDPARPDAWRATPYHADLRRWAVAADKMGFQVYVAIGRRIIAILPHEDVDLGVFGADDRLVYERATVDGRDVVTARKVGAAG
ncbi:MAG TPA: hypothetical protein VFS49_06880 [Croceibacterium sp.]|nr:hypothetical protein [Croceibacterium sp.]